MFHDTELSHPALLSGAPNAPELVAVPLPPRPAKRQTTQSPGQALVPDEVAQ